MLQLLFVCIYNLFCCYVPHRWYDGFFGLETSVLTGVIIGKCIRDSGWIFSTSFWFGLFALLFVCMVYIYLLPVIIVPEKMYIMTVCGKTDIPERGLCLTGTIRESGCCFQVLLEGYPYAFEMRNRVELPVKLKTDYSGRRYGRTPVVTLA